jgi:hypothetical protein
LPKYYDKRTLNHEQAVAWVKQQIIAMGCAFNETHLEAGIDAFAEIADPLTGAALANFLGVQVKTRERFDAESPEKFSFYADAADIAYWASSTIPVLLVVCRSRTDEAHAVWVREYFKTPQNQGTRTVTFDKQRDRFIAGDVWQRRLVDVSVPHSRGLSFPPLPKSENISSNLLEAVLPQTVYSGAAKLKDRPSVIDSLRKHNSEVHEFLLKGDLLWSVHPLSGNAWSEVVEPGSTESMDFSELSLSDDPSKRRYAVELLNLCLSARLRLEDVFWFKYEDMYVYAPVRYVTRRVRKSIRTDTKETRRGLIFPTYFNGRMVRCRHLAFLANFVEIGGVHYLQVDPTYFFSRDGRRKHPRSEDLIRKARILQKEQDYHSNLEVWREVLTQLSDFTRREYPLLRFKDYLRFVSPVSIPDTVWNPPKAASDSGKGDLDQQLSL